jgi:SAM-dependent methyltransferase
MQSEEWRGRVGRAWAAEWQRTDRAFAALTSRLLEALAEAAPAHGRAVDIGCGAGETSLALADLRSGLSVTGVDLSEELIVIARERGAGRANLSFELADAAQMTLPPASVDLFASRHGVMFFDDPVAAFTSFRSTAAPGAQLVFTCFRDWHENRFASDIGQIIGEGAPPPRQSGPFAFAEEDYVRGILEESGWQDIAAEPIDFAFRVGEGADATAEAVDFLTRIGPAARALNDTPEADRPPLLDAIAQACAHRREGDAVDFPAAAWLWQARE